MQSADLKKNSALFDLDKQWINEPNFVLYDFNNPEDIPANIHHTFDCIVIDPPFITQEVWTLYAAAAKLLLAPGGKQASAVFCWAPSSCVTHVCRNTTSYLRPRSQNIFVQCHLTVL